MKNRTRLALVTGLVCLGGQLAHADELFVGVTAEHQTIGSAIGAAQDGDIITVESGRYDETIETQAPGVTIRAATGREVLVTLAGYVVRVRHERITLEGLIIDGQYSDRDGIQVRGEAHNLTLRNVEVRHVANDCVDLGSQRDVLIDGSLIHHCLSSDRAGCDTPDCRRDAHGVGGAAIRNLTLRNTEIHTVSGDAIQLDAGRSEPGWSGLLIEGCRLWSGPLSEAAGGFAAGVNPAENALDTKTSNDVIDPAEVTIRDTHVWGFRGGLIENMAAFNLKENVQVHLDRVTVNDSEIAFRLRGRTESRPRGAQVSMSNTVVYDVDTAVRYEDGIETVRMDNVTLGAEIGRLFQDVSENGRILGRNVLVHAESLPEQLAGGSNLAVGPECFAQTAGDDYTLAAGCSAIDAGEPIQGYPQDRLGVDRPQGAQWDIGAYEFCDGECASPEIADAGVDASTPADAGPPVDATTRPDAVSEDDMAIAMRPDAGDEIDSGQDAGSTTAMSTNSSGGGGCSSGPFNSSTALIPLCLLMLIGLLTRRKRAVAPPSLRDPGTVGSKWTSGRR